MFAVVPARYAAAMRARAARGPPRRRVRRAPPPTTTATAKKKDKRYPDEFTRSSEADPLRSASPTSATFARDAATGKPEMIFDVELPAIDMGITFREAGNTAVVESLKPGGAAEATGCVKPGDVLVRCDATVLEACDTPVTVGGPGVSTKHHRVRGFECLGAPFDTQMTALNSTGVVDAGYLHAKVRVEFQREVPEDAVGDLKKAGHPATSQDFDLRSNASSE